MRPLAFALLSLAALGLGAPSAGAATTDFSVCGASMKADIDVGSTPAGYEGYLGLWTGDWSNGRICSGLIIKKIDSSGDAFVDYIYRFAKATTISSQSAIARIEGGQTLTFNDKDGSRYTFTLKPGDEMAVTFLNTGGTRLEASFLRSTSTASPSATPSEEEEVGRFLKEFFAKGGVARLADKQLSALFRENDEINRRSGDKPMSAEANACECEEAPAARYIIRNIELLGPSSSTAVYEATYGNETKTIRATLSKEEGKWRIHDMISEGTQGSFLLQLEKTNKQLANLVPAEKPNPQQQTSKPPQTNPDERVASEDCFMDGCFKEFIVAKREKTQGILEVKVRTEKYNHLGTGSPITRTMRTVEVSCRPGDGYIKETGGREFKEPEPDPPHATQAAKQLWEAICRASVAKLAPPTGAPPSLAPPTGQTPTLPQGTSVDIEFPGCIYHDSRANGYGTKFKIVPPVDLEKLADASFVRALLDGSAPSIIAMPIFTSGRTPWTSGKGFSMRLTGSSLAFACGRRILAR